MKVITTKAALFAGLFCAIAAPSLADPIPLPSGALVDLHYQGFTAEDPTSPASCSVGATYCAPLQKGAVLGGSLGTDGQYYETTYGAGYLNQIVDPFNSSNTYWAQGQGNQTVSFMIYGIADEGFSPNGTGFNLDNVGCTAVSEGCDGKIHIDFYLDNTTATGGTNPGFLGPGTVVNADERCGFNCLPGITDGTLLMSWDLTPGGSPDDPLATLFQSVFALALPTNGVGDFLANCVAGPECSDFDNAAIPDPTTGAYGNFFGQFTLQTPPPGVALNGWEGLISDPVLSQAPEPGSMLLLGTGLLALFSIGYRLRSRTKLT